MDKRYYYSLTCGTLILVMTILLLSLGTANAQEQCKLVTIWGQAYPSVTVELSPQTLVISKGDCVVWVNWARAAEVRVNFREGKKCQETTQVPREFKFEKGCYLTDYMPSGATSSLRFMKEGTYKYEIEVADSKYPQPIVGAISVK